MSEFSMLDRYPATLVGHVAFLEFVSFEVQSRGQREATAIGRLVFL